MKLILAGTLFCLCSLSVGQTVYSISFASAENSLELVVVNTSSMKTRNIRIVAEGIPDWIRMGTKEYMIEEMESQQEESGAFVFSIEKTAPIRKNETLRFLISTADGQSWTKEISISIAPPEKFELYQNYPNPFNPSTTISYQLTSDSKVSLKVYDLTGQEVVDLGTADRPAGYHQEIWNASGMASGLYVYQLVVTDMTDRETVARKTMIFLK